MKSKYEIGNRVRSIVNKSYKGDYTVTYVYHTGSIEVTTNDEYKHKFNLTLEEQEEYLELVEE